MLRQNARPDHVDHENVDAIALGREDRKIGNVESVSCRLRTFDEVDFASAVLSEFGAQRLADKLNKTEISAAAIHGNKSQSQRTRALEAFKSGRVNVLVATDVAARGLDIPNVSHVINFDTPQVYEDYIHRIGRTGRAGARGHAHTFVPKSGSSY